MRRVHAALAAAVLILAGCSQSDPSIEPKTGPAATPDATTSQPTPSATSPSATPTPEPQVANFDQQNVFDDGVRVEVTKIKHGELSKLDTEVYDSEAKAGAPYVDFTVRVKNGTDGKLALSTSETVTYGPDGDEGEEVYVDDAPGDISATLLPGKSRSVRITYVIPRKYQDDVQLEFYFEDSHDPALFAGSVK